VRSRKKVYGAYLFGAPFIVITLYALQAWVPTLLIRVHGMDIADAGRGYGSIALLCGSAGVLCGPVFAQYLTGKGHNDSGLKVAMLAAAALLPAIVFAGFTADTTLALVAIAISSFFVTVPMALFTTGLQSVTPNEMRGVIAGIYSDWHWVRRPLRWLPTTYLPTGVPSACRWRLCVQFPSQ
jgi:sugar phosphate permease